METAAHGPIDAYRLEGATVEVHLNRSKSATQKPSSLVLIWHEMRNAII